MKMKKTGLFFGSFNPVHIGHLIIANHMVEYTDLDEIFFIVSPHNPLKEKKTLLADHHRLALLRLALEDNPKFIASDIEFKMAQPSYTIDTLAYLTEKYPQKNFVLIMGADNINTIDKWKNYKLILENYKIYIYPRPNAGSRFLDHPNVKLVSAPLLEIASADIRKAIKTNKNVKYLLPEKVFDYIREMHFYEK